MPADHTPTAKGADWNCTPARQLGRVSEDDWATLRHAAGLAGESFTAWALRHLLAAAATEKAAHQRKAARQRRAERKAAAVTPRDGRSARRRSD